MSSNDRLIFPRKLAISLMLALVSLSSQGATVSYLDTVSFNGVNNVPSTIAINFTFDTDTNSINGNVSGILNDGGINFPPNFTVFEHSVGFPLRPLDNSFHEVFLGGLDATGRYQYVLHTDFFVDVNSPLSPLSLANTLDNPLLLGGGSRQQHSFDYFGNSVDFTETLTNLGTTPATIPIPPSLALFASSLLGIGLFGKKARQLG